jgi:hypothetical protein
MIGITLEKTEMLNRALYDAALHILNQDLVRLLSTDQKFDLLMAVLNFKKETI